MQSKKKYVSLESIKKEVKKKYNTTAEIIMLVGKRENGKSFAAKKEAITSAYMNQKKFVLLRRTEEDFKKSGADKYWRDVNEEGWVSKWTNGDYSIVTAYGSNIYLGNIDEKGKVTRDVQIGDYYPLSTYVKSKSVAFPKSYNLIIFEEFITDEGYLHDETHKFFQFISTVFRGRKGVIIMVGNTIDPSCLYFSEWGMNVVEQKDGTTELYKYNETDDSGEPYTVNIAVNVAEKQDGGSSHMVFGTGRKAVGGEWVSKRYTHPKEKIKYKSIYKLILASRLKAFIVELVKDDFGLGVRVYPTKANKPIEDLGITRIIYTYTIPVMDLHPLHTSKFLKTIPAESKIMELLKDDTKTGYSSNVVGSQFKSIIKETRLLGW